MKRSRAAFACALLAAVTLTACGSDAERDKSATDIAESVRKVQSAMKVETAAIKAGDARAEAEEVQLVSQVEHERLAKLAQRAPAETQDFADAAEEWTQAVHTSRTALLDQADEDTSTVAMLNVRLSAKAMDAEAAELDIEPWLKLDKY